MPAGTPAGRCPLEVLSRTGGPCARLSCPETHPASRNTPAFPVSLVKRYERIVISGEIRVLCSRLFSDCQFCLTGTSSARIRCVGEQIFLNINDDNITEGRQLGTAFSKLWLPNIKSKARKTLPHDVFAALSCFLCILP